MVDAQKIKEVASKKASAIVNGVSGKVPPHQHCRVCHEPIPLKSDPRVCSKQSCIEKNQRDEKNQRSVRIWMFIFFGLFVLSFVVPILF